MARELNDADLDAIYRRVEQRAIETTQRQEQPVAILLGGQPGSGKAGLAGVAQRELRDRGGAVVIDADQMRGFNPAYRALAKADPERAADQTQALAGKWASRLTKRAEDERRNLVVDGTMRNPDNIAALAERLQRAGYTVEARVMAVPSDPSFDRARLRYEQLAAEGQVGRVVNREQHDAAYRGLPETVGRLERDGLADRIRIYDSHGREVYNGERDRDREKQAPGKGRDVDRSQAQPEAARTLESVRERLLTHGERGAHIELLEEIVEHTRARNERTPGVGPQDLAEVSKRLQAAREDRTTFEHSEIYKRAKVFDDGPNVAALARYPEFDGAFRQLADVRKGWQPDTPLADRQQQYFDTLGRLSEQLHRGEIPGGNTTLAESQRVMGVVARERNLMIRTPEPDRVLQGDVVAKTSQHALVQVSENMVVMVERGKLDREINQGEKTALLHSDQGTTKVLTHDEARELQQNRQGMDLERSR
ncbi:zeta toxin family protein [Burkholderia stagnalis]|uniref:zeta toxin family protein n=1 Tax=Burkholderia stagnalis TaxID=1503054 RepID=UPI0007553D22|nr:zeta toxin family protein [Burkholderia stagnalis]KWI31956.1 toxin [Burkholderia stagnalis]KWI72854.1 toxin [Burkholderia stagnalis]MDY7806136.1 zeta toxin family protein [Burkholderia stagnalis]